MPSCRLTDSHLPYSSCALCPELSMSGPEALPMSRRGNCLVLTGIALLIVTLASAQPAWSRGGGHGGGHSSFSSGGSHSYSAPHVSTPSVGGAVHVHGYTRKDGTYVAPYTRSAPHEQATTTVPNTSTPSRSSATTVPSRESRASAASHAAPGVMRDDRGRIKRGEEARAAFERSHPCPSTGKSSGGCPGYVVDHIVALKRGGADAPSNMEWQTIEAAKAKDKWE